MSDDATSSSALGTFGTENENIAEAVHRRAGREMSTMKSKYLRFFVAAGALGLAVAGWTTSARAQAPAGPLPAAQSQQPSARDARPQEQIAPVKPRTSILGAWKLNRDESHDPRKKTQEARGGNRGGGGRGGVRMSNPGIARGPYAGRRRGIATHTDPGPVPD